MMSAISVNFNAISTKQSVFVICFAAMIQHVSTAALPNVNHFEGFGSLNEGADLCQRSEWFAFVGSEHACVSPLWTTGYDPDYCSKMKYGEVYCSCLEDESHVAKTAIETCVKSAELNSNARCNLQPCPDEATCRDTIPGERFDCIVGNVIVPFNYRGKE